MSSSEDEYNKKSPEIRITPPDGNGETVKAAAAFYAWPRIPVPKLEEYNDFSCWLNCVEAWSATSDIPKSKQGFFLACELPISSKRYGDSLREDLYKEVKPNKLVNNENGVEEIITFLKSRFYIDEENDIISTHKKIIRMKRKRDQNMTEFVLEYDKMMKKAKQLNMQPDNDLYMALNIMEAANLTDQEEMMLRTVAKFTKADGKRYERMKQKLREIFAKLGEEKSSNNEVFLANANSEDDIQKYDDVYLSRGWMPPKRHGKYQNNKPRYQNKQYDKNKDSGASRNDNKNIVRKRKFNPLGPDGKPLQCIACRAITHMLRECPDSYENKNTKGNKRYQTAYVVNETTDEEREVLIEVSDTDSEKDANVFCAVYCNENKDDLSSFTAEALNMGALDTACTASVAGEKWIKIYLEALPKDMKERVEGPMQSDKQFVFGNQGKLKSKSKYNIPIRIGGIDNKILIDIIDSDIPLLLSKGDMKKIGIALDIKNDKGYINGKPLILTTTTAGHYVVDLLKDTERIEEVNTTELENNDHSTQMKALSKIHRQFGHRSKRQFVTILKEANKWQDKFSNMIDTIMDKCEGCILRKRTPDRPAVAPPLSSDFGQVLGLDIKVWDKNKGIYILYMIDHFTRYQVASVIKSKEPSEVVKVITLKWLPFFGRVDKIITDNGGEFCNEHIREVTSALNIEHLTTGANSPWQNGTVEKNHQSTDAVINAVQRDYPKMNLEIALAWAVTAVNSMSSVRGFSPHQLVFGRQIKLPNILEDPPPTWEIPTKSRELIDTLNAIHATRVKYTEAERCERIRKALKAKIRVADTIYDKGDIVYYKKEGEDTWRGPAKVVFQDNKVIFIRIGSIYYRVSANRLIKAGEGLAKEIRDKEASNDETHEQQAQTSERVMTRNQMQQEEKDEEPDWTELRMDNNQEKATIEEVTIEDAQTQEIIPTFPETDNNEGEAAQEENQINNDEPQNRRRNTGRKRRKVLQKPVPEFNEDGTLTNAETVLKKNDRIEIFEKGKWEKGIVLGHGGKVGGIHSGWYNLQLDNGEVFPDNIANRQVRYENQEEDEDEILVVMKLDNGKIIKMRHQEDRRIRIENEEDCLALLCQEEILAVMVPKDERDSPECVAAKKVELEKLKIFNTYQVVEDNGQERITTTWVLTQKGDEKRARLTARGFQEEANFPTDSPTVQKHSIRLILTVASTNNWDIKTTDITSAFLQGSKMDRDVFIKPPREAEEKGKLWKLIKCLYGLKDASRKWYFRVLNKLKELGFQQAFCDKAVFFLIKDNKLLGVIALHVDDFLHAGDPYFNKTILPQILSVFKVGKSETRVFMYTGFQLKQDNEGITLDQEKYVRNVQIPNVDIKLLKEKKREMNQTELTLLRQLTGMVNWAARATRPDLSYEMIESSTKFKGGLVEDLIHTKNVALRLKKIDVAVRISNLGNFNDCQVWVYTDAAFRNLNDGKDSCGGFITFIVNNKSGKCAPIEWSSGKIKRKVHSTLAAETLALNKGIDAALGIKYMLKEITAGTVNLPVKVITDNRSARDAIYSESEVAERMLRADISIVKDMIEDGRISEVKWIPGPEMLADIFTKRGVNKIPLLDVLQSGRMTQHTLDLINN